MNFLSNLTEFVVVEKVNMKDWFDGLGLYQRIPSQKRKINAWIVPKTGLSSISYV